MERAALEHMDRKAGYRLGYMRYGASELRGHQDVEREQPTPRELEWTIGSPYELLDSDSNRTGFT